ncbi:hypothetical protein BH20ACI1_BH20ACI1_16560 [soil metagenome]
MKTCSVCRRCYEDAAAVCVENHGILIAERAGTLEIIPNYRLDSLLERDAVGESYAATNIALDQPFVIKIIAQNLLIGAGEQARQTLQREVQAAANLDHPNIARVYESGSLDGGAFYVVTESIGDKTLQGLLRNTGALSEPEAVKIARQTAEGLMAAHAAGIIHRAVSPANIVLTRNPQNQLFVKLRNFDFGGIKQQFTTGKFAADAKIDTLRYLSPEQSAGKSVDAQTDVYSLGIVLYEMLCGRSPFNAPTSEAITDRKINEQPLSQLRFDVRALLTHTIKESLQKRPAARLQIGNFARQLRHITQLILPLGENLPAAPQILLSNETASDAPEFTESPIEVQSPHEVITLDNVDMPPTNEAAEQQNVGQIEETTADEMPPLGKLVPIFVMQNEADDISSSAESILAENEDADFEPNQIVEENRIDEISFEADAAQTDEVSADEISSFGELAPVFIMKNEAEADLSAEEPISAENSDMNFNSVEANPILAEQRQVDEISFESDTAQIEETPTNKISDFGELVPVFFEKNQVDEIPYESEPIITERETVDAASTEPEVFVFPDEVIENKRETAAPNFTNYPNQTPPPRFLQANRSAIVGAGLIAVLVSVMLGALLYYRMQNPTASEQTTTAAVPPTAQNSSDAVDDSTDTAAINDKNDTAETTQTDETETKNSVPIAAAKTPLTASKRADQKPSEETTAANPAVKQNEPIQEQAVREKPTTTANGKPQTELNSALDDWISATNSRNVEQQMNYYAPKLNAYYLTRNASQGAVRAEKKRIFSRADEVDIQAGKPDITVSPDGQTATMRFRKKYSIRQGQQNRNGEVIQELQWVKSDDGWRIVSERDVKVINR